jgi:hypothetical protein
VIARLRRNALIACVVMACAASFIARSAWWGIAVAGGGVLIGISFVVIASGVDALDHRRPALILLKVTGRYALLGFLAYVMIARLRLPPLGLILGASSFAVAALVELIINRRH